MKDRIPGKNQKLKERECLVFKRLCHFVIILIGLSQKKLGTRRAQCFHKGHKVGKGNHMYFVAFV